MARRQGVLDDLIKAGFKLPWWVTALLAILAFLTCHAIALQTASPTTGTTLGDVGAVAQHSLMHMFASIVQYLIPAGLLIGALGSFGARVRSRLLFAAAQRNTVAVSAMSWRDFEKLVGEAFRSQGYAVTGFGGNGPAGGVDLGLSKNGERFLVQCKHWRKRQVGVTVVRELNGVIAALGANGGYVVTGGEFTREAREFAGSSRIRLIDGTALDELIAGVRLPLPRPACESRQICPHCGSGMVKCEARKGPFAGQQFWGCQQYPRCMGLVQIS